MRGCRKGKAITTLQQSGLFVSKTYSRSQPLAAKKAQKVISRGQTVNYWHVLLLPLMFFIDEGIPSLFIGARDFTQGRMITTVIISLSIIYAIFAKVKNFKFSNIDFIPILLFIWVVFASFISNVYIFGYELRNWFFALYTLIPILAFVMWWAVGMTATEVLYGIVVTGFIAALLNVADRFAPIPALDGLRRMSAYGAFGNTDRLVFLKDECVLAGLLLFANLLTHLGRRGQVSISIVPLLLIGYVEVEIFESRLSILITIVAIAVFMLTANINSARRLFAIMLSLTVGIPLGAWLLDKYITPLLSNNVSRYIENTNVEIRFISNEYFARVFAETWGNGIGVMSTNPESPNVISNVVAKAYNLNDLGLFAALYQFGIVGITLAIAMSVIFFIGMYRIGKGSIHPKSSEIFMVSSFFLASLIQPIPINFITLPYSCFFGSTLWYLFRRVSYEVDAMRANAKRRSA